MKNIFEITENNFWFSEVFEIPLFASQPVAPVMKLSDHPLPVPEISSENVFHWWSHQVFRNQGNQKFGNDLNFPLQYNTIVLGFKFSTQVLDRLPGIFRKNSQANKFLTPLPGSPALALPIPVPYYPMSRNDLRS